MLFMLLCCFGCWLMLIYVIWDAGTILAKKDRQIATLKRNNASQMESRTIDSKVIRELTAALNLEKKRAQAMHRRAQCAEGKLLALELKSGKHIDELALTISFRDKRIQDQDAWIRVKGEEIEGLLKQLKQRRGYSDYLEGVIDQAASHKSFATWRNQEDEIPF